MWNKKRGPQEEDDDRGGRSNSRFLLHARHVCVCKKKGSAPTHTQKPPFLFRFSPYIDDYRAPGFYYFLFTKVVVAVSPYILQRTHTTHIRCLSYGLFGIKSGEPNWGGRWWSNKLLFYFFFSFLPFFSLPPLFFFFFASFSGRLQKPPKTQFVYSVDPLEAKWTGSASSVGRETT